MDDRDASFIDVGHEVRLQLSQCVVQGSFGNCNETLLRNAAVTICYE